MPVICRLPQKSSGSVVLTGTAIESDVASGKTFYNTDSNTKLTGTASGGGMVLPIGADCRPTGAVTIPSGVTSIAQYAFYQNTAVTSVVMPNTITTMADSVFTGCTNLANVTLSNNLSNVSDHAFAGCSNLTDISFPSSITQLSGGAFNGCTKLNNINIPTNITTILMQSFCACSGLTTITINAIVININNYTFQGCINLEFVTLASGFNCTLNLSYSTKYSRDTIMAMINAYVNASGKTLTMGATNLAKLSTEDKAVASNKGLTLA